MNDPEHGTIRLENSDHPRWCAGCRLWVGFFWSWLEHREHGPKVAAG